MSQQNLKKMPKLKEVTTFYHFYHDALRLLRLAEMNAVWIPSWDDHDDKLGLQGSPGFQLSSSRSAQEDCEAKPELEAQRRDLRKLLLRLRTWNDLNKRIGDGREGQTTCPCLQGIFSARSYLLCPIQVQNDARASIKDRGWSRFNELNILA